MGVNREYFVIYGIKAKYGDFALYDEVDDPEFFKGRIVDAKSQWYIGDDTDNELILISDGMCGEYTLLGILVARSGTDRFCDEDDIYLNMSKQDVSRLEEKFHAEMNAQNIDVSSYKVGLIVNRHYS